MSDNDVTRPLTATDPHPNTPPASTPPASTGELLTVGEVAVTLRVSTMTVYRLIHNGAISALRIGRVLRPHRQSVEDFLRNADHDSDRT